MEEPGKEKKVDVSKLASIIPPASELFKKEKKLSEKRIRIRYDSSLSPDAAKVPSALAKLLDIKDNDPVEIVIAGRKKFRLQAVVFESQEENVVFVAPAEFEKSGVADNSIATIRRVQ